MPILFSLNCIEKTKISKKSLRIAFLFYLPTYIHTYIHTYIPTEPTYFKILQYLLLTSDPRDWYPAISMVWPWSAVTTTIVSSKLIILSAVSTAKSRAMASWRATLAYTHWSSKLSQSWLCWLDYNNGVNLLPGCTSKYTSGLNLAAYLGPVLALFLLQFKVLYVLLVLGTFSTLGTSTNSYYSTYV